MYTLVIYLIDIYLQIKGVFDLKTRTWNQKRAHQLATLKKQMLNNDGVKIIWIHCASLGEYQQIAYLISLIKSNISKVKILLTFFSPSGFENVKNASVDYMYYLPMDFKAHAKIYIEAFKPSLFIGVKYEWWWNLFDQLNQYQIPKLLVAVKINKSHYILNKFNTSFRKILSKNSAILVQDQSTYDLLTSINIKEIKIAGDPRIDSVLAQKTLRTNNHDDLLDIIGQQHVIIYGSVYKEDTPLIKHAIQQHANMFHIIVPHEVSIKNIDLFLSEFNNPLLFSNIHPNNINTKVLVVDTIGSLFGLYSIAHYCYIGGGFTRNVHNVLEPAVYGLPIAIGPKHGGFTEIEYFKNHRLIEVIRKPTDFSRFVQSCDEQVRHRIRVGLGEYLDSHRGSSTIIANLIREIVYKE
ncbi:MAG TPA: glycosyltransferase N-terminal domain-containing protein [Saprospiraceae bacterium]|nr:glycosyltransferase N-terminal domain-containing protein [Saprospiraceae bacterium]